MSKFNLVSSKRLIAELFSDYNLVGTDWVNKAQRHITRAIELMQIDGYFEFKTSFDVVQEGRVPLPCESKYLLGVLLKDKNRVCRLPLTRDLDLNSKLNGLIYHEYFKGYINNNYLNTSFDKGVVCFLYYGIPTDDCGDLMIPDNAELFEAIPYFIIYKLGFSGYKHPMIKPTDAYQMWEALYPRASNTINYPSLEEMQRFTEINTNPLYIYVTGGNGVNFTEAVNRFYKEGNLLGSGDTSKQLTEDMITNQDGIVIVNNHTTIEKTVVESVIQGWILLNNPLFTSSSPYTGQQDIPFKMPISNNVINDSNATLELKNLVNEDGTINMTSINNSYIGSVTFKIRSSVPSREGHIKFKMLDDLGNTEDITITTDSFFTNDDAGVEKSITINLPFYVLDSIDTYNKLYLEATIESDFEIYDVQLYVDTTYNG